MEARNTEKQKKKRKSVKTRIVPGARSVVQRSGEVNLRPSLPSWKRKTRFEKQASKANGLFDKELQARDEEMMVRIAQSKSRRVKISSETASCSDATKSDDGLKKGEKLSKDAKVPKDKVASGSGESKRRDSSSASKGSEFKEQRSQSSSGAGRSNAPSTSALAPQLNMPNISFEDESAAASGSKASASEFVAQQEQEQAPMDWENNSSGSDSSEFHGFDKFEGVSGDNAEPEFHGFDAPSRDQEEPTFQNIPAEPEADRPVRRILIEDYKARKQQIKEERASDPAFIPAAYRQDLEEGEITDDDSAEEEENVSSDDDDLQVVAVLTNKQPALAESKASLRKRWLDHPGPGGKRSKKKVLPSDSDESEDERLHIDEERPSSAARDANRLVSAAVREDTATLRRNTEKKPASAAASHSSSADVEMDVVDVVPSSPAPSSAPKSKCTRTSTRSGIAHPTSTSATRTSLRSSTTHPASTSAPTSMARTSLRSSTTPPAPASVTTSTARTSLRSSTTPPAATPAPTSTARISVRSATAMFDAPPGSAHEKGTVGVGLEPASNLGRDPPESASEKGTVLDGAASNPGRDSDEDDAVELELREDDLEGLWPDPEPERVDTPTGPTTPTTDCIGIADIVDASEDVKGRGPNAPLSEVEKSIADMPPTARIRFETLSKKRLCFSFLELGHCRKDEQRRAALIARGKDKEQGCPAKEIPPGCNRSHEFSFDDVRNVFRLVREVDDDKLPVMLRTARFSRKLQRLMGLYTQTQRWMADRMEWLQLFTMAVEALVSEKKTPLEEEQMVNHLRTLSGQWFSKFEVPMAKCELALIRKAVDAFSKAVCVSVALNPVPTMSLMWRFLMFAIRTGLVLGKETYGRMLKTLYANHEAACKSGPEVVTMRIYPLQYVAHLPGHTLDLKTVELCVDRLVLLLDVTEVTELLLPVILVLPPSDLRRLPRNVLQKLVNKCFQQNVFIHPRALQTLHKIRSDGAKGVVWQTEDLPRPVVDLQFEERLGRSILFSNWQEVAKMYLQRDRKNAFQLHGFHVAFFEELIRLGTSKAVDEGFQKFLDCLKLPDLTDLEERFLVQLSATLVVHMASLEEEMAEQLTTPLLVYSIPLTGFSTPVWTYGALLCPTSTEPVLRTHVERPTVALACVRMLIRRGQVNTAVRVLTKDAEDVVLREQDKLRVFQVASECCRRLLNDPTREMSEARLGDMCIDIFNNFVHYAAISQELSDEEVPAYQQLFNMVALRNIQLSTGELSHRLMTTTFPFVDMRLGGGRGIALTLNAACTRGLVHLLSEAGSDHADKMYSVGVRNAVYSPQDLGTAVVVAERTMTHFELQVLLRVCLRALWDEYLGPELHSRLASANSSEELEQLAEEVNNVSVHVIEEPATWSKTELSFLDTLAVTTVQDALVRIEQVLSTFCPEFVLERESDRVAISSVSLLQYFQKTAEVDH